MPQDGSNNYQYPPGTPGVPDQTIESEAYNTFLDDLVVNDLNFPRPVHRGGTGATDANTALVNLTAEKAAQLVADYSSQVWLPGSFYSAISATAAPVAGHAFAGICYLNEPLVFPPTNANVIIEARDESDTTVPGRVYVRQKKAGVWDTAWTVQAGSVADMDLAYVNTGGDTMTGLLTLSGNPTADMHASTKQYVDGGVAGIPGKVSKAGDIMTGLLTLSGDPTAIMHAATKQYVDGGISGVGGAPNVRYTPQTLTAAQQVQARQNIYAAPFDAMAYSGLQINGGMEVSQENGTSGIVLSGAAKYIVDGFGVAMIGTGTATASQISIASLPGFTSCIDLNCTAANPLAGSTDGQWIYQSIEGYRWSRLAYGSAGVQPVTIGFWIFPNVSGNIAVSLRASGSPRSYVVDVAVTAGSWQYKTVTIPGDALLTWATLNTVAATLAFCFGAGSGRKTTANAWSPIDAIATASTTNFFASAGQIYLTGVTVLPGNEAPTAAQSPFIMRPYDQELVSCKRYYQTIAFAFDKIATVGEVASSANVFSPEMRAAPTITAGGPDASSGYPSVGFVYTTNKKTGVQAAATVTARNFWYGAATADARL